DKRAGVRGLSVIPRVFERPKRCGRTSVGTFGAGETKMARNFFAQLRLPVASVLAGLAAATALTALPAFAQNLPAVPQPKGPAVALMRRRLEMTDDLPSAQAAGEAYDEHIAEGVRRFQARHGLEQTGIVGPKTLAALNVPVSKRLHQLAASLDRLAGMDLVFGRRYVVVNLPAAFAEAVVGNKVVRRHVVQVGRPDRPSP